MSCCVQTSSFDDYAPWLYLSDVVEFFICDFLGILFVYGVAKQSSVVGVNLFLLCFGKAPDFAVVQECTADVAFEDSDLEFVADLI